jgi:hypothetical protein
MSSLSVVRLSVLVAAVAVAVAGCGGGAAHPAAPASASGASALAVVLSACETDGATALLPGSDGQDAAPGRDDTAAVCGCWVRWMQRHLGPHDRDAVATGVTLSASVMSITNVALVDRLAAVLRGCEPRPGPGRGGTARQALPATSPGP